MLAHFCFAYVLLAQSQSRAHALEAIPNPLQFGGDYGDAIQAVNRGLSESQATLVRQLWEVAGPGFKKAVQTQAFGVSEIDLRKMCFAVTREILKDDYTLDGVTDPKIIEARIRKGIDPILTTFEVVPDTALAERLRAQGYADWTRTRLMYDQTYFTVWDDSRKRQGDQSRFVLSWTPRRAVCGGIQVTFRDLAQAGGLKCRMITCQTRGRDGARSDHADHTVAIVTFKNGASLPFDGSSSTISLSDAQRLRGAIHSLWSLPITPSELMVFVGYRHQFNENATSFGDKQNEFEFTTASLSNWRQWDVRQLDRFEPKPMLNSGFYYGR